MRLVLPFCSKEQEICMHTSIVRGCVALRRNASLPGYARFQVGPCVQSKRGKAQNPASLQVHFPGYVSQTSSLPGYSEERPHTPQPPSLSLTGVTAGTLLSGSQNTPPETTPATHPHRSGHKPNAQGHGRALQGYPRDKATPRCVNLQHRQARASLSSASTPGAPSFIRRSPAPASHQLTQPSKLSLGPAERRRSWKCKVQLATKSS